MTNTEIEIANAYGTVVACADKPNVCLTVREAWEGSATITLTADEARKLADTLNQAASRVDPPNPLSALQL